MGLLFFNVNSARVPCFSLVLYAPNVDGVFVRAGNVGV